MQLFMYISRIIYILIGRVAMAAPRGGQEPLPLKVAPIQPSVTAASHLQSRRDSECQMWEFPSQRPLIFTWANYQDTDDLRTHHTHYDLTVMVIP